jgi:predicted DNA-binding transcriptional regulator AlpA
LSDDNTKIAGVTESYLVGAAEIAEMLGISRQRVDAIARTHDDFPEPEAVLASGRIWLRTAIQEWAHASGRL